MPSRIADQAQGDDCELLADGLGALDFGRFVQRQEGRRPGRQLVRAYAALGEHLAHRPNGRDRLAPARVLGQVDDGFGNLAWLDAVLDRLVGIVGEGLRFAARHHRRDGDQAAVVAVRSGRA